MHKFLGRISVVVFCTFGGNGILLLTDLPDTEDLADPEVADIVSNEYKNLACSFWCKIYFYENVRIIIVSTFFINYH